MGKRKKAAKPPTKTKKNEGLPTVFQCLFCNHDASVTVKMEKKQGMGQLSCKVCGQSFQTTINYLSAPVDVYYDWVDACDKIAKEGAEATAGVSPPRLSNNRVGAASSRAAAGASGSGEMDDFLEDDEMDAEGDFTA